MSDNGGNGAEECYIAMSAIGLNTNIVNLVKKGGKPIALGFCCWTMISIVSIVIQLLTGIYATNL